MLAMRTIGSIVVLALCAGCGSTTSQSEPASKPAPIEVEEPQAPPTPPPGSVWREDVVATVDAGLGRFLRRVEVQPHFDDGRFVGFQIVELRPADWWAQVDLQPGDVILSVNDMPIERDVEAFKAFESLRTAEELSVQYLRQGEERSLEYSIIKRTSENPAPQDSP